MEEDFPGLSYNAIQQKLSGIWKDMSLLEKEVCVISRRNTSIAMICTAYKCARCGKTR
jgi:hypothetical protein